MLWTGRKAPIPSPTPSYFTPAETTYTATDTGKNSWVLPIVPTNPNGAAIVTIPGGAYLNEGGWPDEGVDFSDSLITRGVTMFVLKYRVGMNNGAGPFQHPCEMWDGQRAVRWVRAHAAQYKIDIHRVGIAGFSAGGHLASTVSTHFDSGSPSSTSINYYPGMGDSIDAYSCRPDFVILGYAMTNMDSSFAYMPGKAALLGPSPSAALQALTTNEAHVTSNTPPTFMTWDTQDATVNPKNSTHYYDSLLVHGVPADTITFPINQHGYALADGKGGSPNLPAVHVWFDTLLSWMNRQGYLTAATAILPMHRNAVMAPASKVDQGALDLLGRRLSNPDIQHDETLKIPQNQE